MVDFVMDDLDWKIFGLDFVDGIVVSILDSFGFCYWKEFLGVKLKRKDWEGMVVL